MNAKCVLNQLRDLTECSICIEPLKDQRILPCGHTFCLQCLKNIETTTAPQKDDFPCPLCRSKFTVPKNGLAGLPRNFIVEKLVDFTSSQTLEAASSASQVHDDLLASASIQSNGRQQRTLTCKGEASGRKQSPTNLCKQHPSEEVSFYCYDCKVTFCLICLKETHRNHVSLNLKEFREELNTTIDNNIAKLSDCVNEGRHRKENLQQAKVELLAKIEESEEAIRRKTSRLKQFIDEQSQSLISDLEKLKHNRLKEIENEKEELERHLAMFESWNRFLEKVKIKQLVNDIGQTVEKLNSEIKKIHETESHWTTNRISVNPSMVFLETPIDEILNQNRNVVGKIEVRHERPLNLLKKLAVENQSVRGVASMSKTYFVICWDSPFVEIFKDNHGSFLHQSRIKISGLSSAQDIVFSANSSCLYVSDQGNACVWKITVKDHKVRRWLTLADDPYTLSLTNEGHLLMAKNEHQPSLMIYNSEANLMKSIALPKSAERVWHAVQSSSVDRYFVSQGSSIYDVNSDGKILRSFFLESSARYFHLASAGGDGHLFVADYINGKILLLDDDLRLSKTLLDVENDKIQWPCRLSYERNKCRLIIVHREVDIYSFKNS